MKQFEVFVRSESEIVYSVEAKDKDSALKKVRSAIDNDTSDELASRVGDQGSQTLTGEVIEQ
jgi:hypothetical protein